ncbi:hypothetical protein DNHGIG_01010 [Collibacillus ludicampi]|jgi:uncharacterized membrane protein|uniref:Small integral membrane protein n=1 Tax=Collibacillus ludicampi TaxID=2771369 RepID=A0AAV4L9U9_9BACL|nr:DUF2273 domain-containing protein [Collibacillus ludicampi]GIM44552.1 hypothetical protein DNHGIG_01010 [Collibacillus ludicampi]
MKETLGKIGLWLLSADRRFLGALLGGVFGLLYLIVGFWKTIVFLGFVLLGYSLGRMFEVNEDWRDVIDRIMPNKSRD